MWFLAIATCLCFGAATVLASPRGLTACPRHWEPEGEDANGCPSRCLNRATGERIHLLVRYTLKGALLKGCVQCEERWIENTDCVLILCPENTSCSEELALRPANSHTFQLSSRGAAPEKPRHLSLELFKKLYPAEVLKQELPGGGVVRLYMPTHGPQIPRYTRVPQIPIASVQSVPTSPPDMNAEIVVVNDYPRPGPTTESIANLASATANSFPLHAPNGTLRSEFPSTPTTTVVMNPTSSESPRAELPVESGNPGDHGGNVETTTEVPEHMQTTIPPPAPAPRVKSRYSNVRTSTTSSPR